MKKKKKGRKHCFKLQILKRSVKYLSLDNTYKQICFFRSYFVWPSDLKLTGRQTLSKMSLDLCCIINHEHYWLFQWCVLGLVTSLAISVNRQ